MTDEQIKDEIRLGIDSGTHSLTTVVREVQHDVREMQHDFKKHREEELVSRETYRSLLIADVKKEMQVNFNGKMDKVMLKLDTLIERSAPVIKQYEDTKTTWSTIKKWGIHLGILGGIIASAKVIISSISK